MIYGLGMVLQSTRFDATPAYRNLSQMLDIRLWGVAYLMTAIMFSVYTLLTTGRLYGIITHIVALVVTGIWLLAFVIRWLTDSGTTVVNVGSWLVLTLIIARSASLIPPVGPTRERKR
jgi:hypothetical protein